MTLTNNNVFLSIYMITYLLNLTCLCYIVKTSISEKITLSSIPEIHFHIMTYSKLKNIYTGLLLTLSGLPPFILFFIKFNFLLSILSKTAIYSCTLIYIIFFLNMMFYIQTFLNKNYNKNQVIFTEKKQNINYLIIYFIVFNLFLTVLSMFFFQDFFLILSLMFK